MTWGRRKIKLGKSSRKPPGPRVHQLAKELKIDSKQVIFDAKRHGVDVEVPSNTIPFEVADRIREKYFPRKPLRDMTPRAVFNCI